MSSKKKRPPKPRIAMIGVGHLGNAGPSLAMRQGVVMLVVLMNKMCEHFDVSFYSLKPLHEIGGRTEVTSYSVSDGIMPTRLKSLMLFIRMILHHFKSPFDVVYAVSPFPAGRIAIILGWIIRRQVVIHLIGDEMVSMPEIGYGQLLNKKLSRINKWVCRNATEVVVLSEYQKKVVQKNLGFERDIKVLPLQTDLRKFLYSPQPLASPFQFIHIAHFHPVKDQVTLFYAFSKIVKEVDCSLTVIGDGFDSKIVHDLIEELSLKEKIHFVGAIPHEEVASLLSKAHILLHSSRYEAQCTAIMEAMACGVVVCGTSVGVLADNESLGVVVSPADSEALAYGTLQLVKNPIEYDRLRTKARKFIEEYSSDKLSMAYVDLLKKRSTNTNKSNDLKTGREFESIISFYNSVAEAYDNHLTKEDVATREEVAKIFVESTKKGAVLDFGGGTGLDLPWLLATEKYQVTFLEPSSKMREVAKNRCKNQTGVTFLEDNLNFNEWSPRNLPFEEKMDGVLVNFAVVNCIKNIKAAFAQLSLICKTDGCVIVTMINPAFLQIQKSYSVLTAIRLYFYGTLTILNRNEGIYHETYLHSLKRIRKAIKKYFEFKSIVAVPRSSFVVIVLVKK